VCDVQARKTTSIRLSNGWRGVVRVPANGEGSSDCPALADWPAILSALCRDPASMDDYSLLKQSPDAQVVSASMSWNGGARHIIGKRDLVTGLAAKCVSAFRSSRARRNFDRALVLLRAGLRTAQPLAAIERGAFKNDAWMVAQRVDGLIDLDQVALMSLARIDTARSRVIRNQGISAIVDFLVGLEQAGLSHRDLKASNILLAGWDDAATETRVVLVDLDGLTARGEWNEQRRRKTLVRLAASLLEYPSITRADYGRFLRQYITSIGDTRSKWKVLYRQLAPQARNYVGRARGRKKDKIDGFGGIY